MWRSLWRSIDRFSSQHFKQVINELRRIKVVDLSNRELVIDLLQSIVEIVTYGDKQDPLLFELFMEYQVLAEFVRLLKVSKKSWIEAPLLQYLSIMIQNMSNEQAIYYCLSNDYVNNIILHDFKYGVGDLASYFVSFLRAVSSKLNRDTLCLLVKVHEDAIVSFPLYTEALKFSRHGEKMIQTAVRALTLNIYNVKDDMVYNYVTSSPSRVYFSELAQSLKDQTIVLDGFVHKTDDVRGTDDVIQVSDKIVDDLYYMKDILSIGDSRLTRTVSHDLLHFLLFPLMLPLLNPSENKDCSISLISSLYMLCRVVQVVGGRDIVSLIAKFVSKIAKLGSHLYAFELTEEINGIVSHTDLSEFHFCNYCFSGFHLVDEIYLERNNMSLSSYYDDPSVLVGILFLLYTVNENKDSEMPRGIIFGKCLPRVVNALLEIFAKEIPVTMKSDVGWFIYKLLKSADYLSDLNLQGFQISYNKALAEFENQLDNRWFEHIPDTLKSELNQTKVALDTPFASKDPLFLLNIGTSKTDDSSWNQMVDSVKTFALHVRMNALLRNEQVPETQMPDTPKVTHASDLSSATFGSEISLGAGTPCTIAINNAGIRDIYMIPVSNSARGKLLLAEKHPLRSNRGVVFAVGPLGGLNPKVDEVHSEWLRLTISDMNPRRKTVQPDGQWVLGFYDAKLCEEAQSHIMDEIKRQRCFVRTLVSPLLELTVHED